MKIISAIICVVLGHDWKLVGPEMGYVKYNCARCNRRKHSKIVSNWYEMRKKAEGGFCES